MEINQYGYQDYYFDKYNEMISMARPKVYACNLVMGTLYVDFEGTVEALNHQTKERAEITFICRGWASNSSVSAKFFDRNGQQTHDMSGSWWDKLTLTEKSTGRSEVVF